MICIAAFCTFTTWPRIQFAAFPPPAAGTSEWA
jgi:hypothetical protein